MDNFIQHVLSWYLRLIGLDRSGEDNMPIGDIMIGINTKYIGSALASVLTGGIWDTQAPEGTAHPYCVVQTISAIGDPTFTEDMEFFRIQFNLITNNLNKSEVSVGLNALESTLRALFDDAILTVSAWTNTGMIYKSSGEIFSFSNKVIGVMVEYETYIFRTHT
jgi:hypothetical protein